MKSAILILSFFLTTFSYAQNMHVVFGSGFEGEKTELTLWNGSEKMVVFSDTLRSNEVVGFAGGVSFDIGKDFSLELKIDDKVVAGYRMISKRKIRRKYYIRIEYQMSSPVSIVCSDKPFLFY